MNKDRPWVTLNVAMTADGKIDTSARQGAQISSPTDWERVDLLRAESDAVMVGGKTLLREDPRLTVKSADLRAERLERGLGENPAKVGIISEAALEPDSRFLTFGPAQTKLFTTRRTSSDQIGFLRDMGVQVFVAGDQRVDLAFVMQSLQEQGVERVLVEGGGTLNSELLRLKLVDEIYLYVAPLIFGGAGSPTVADGIGFSHDEALKLELKSVKKLKDDGILINYTVL
jgi:2,5-diamino-6-(ribosylamino)-4(3H)-pyrimidinone 5'-phosphate reductase